MLVYCQIDPNKVTTYKTEPGVTDSAAKVASIKERDSYESLKSSIGKEGLLDPVVMCITPGRPMFVEIGERRVLISRDLGITSMPAIAYDRLGAKIGFPYERELNDIDDVEALFRTFTVFIPEVCEQAGAVCQRFTIASKRSVSKQNPVNPVTGQATTIDALKSEFECDDADGLRTLKKYTAAGIAHFGE